MKLVCWNKDFYEKCKDIFTIDVFAKVVFSNTSQTYGYRYNYTSASNQTQEVYLSMSPGWYEENGYIILKSGVKYPVRNVYMRVEDEVADLFSDLKPWFDYTVSWTTMTL